MIKLVRIFVCFISLLCSSFIWAQKDSTSVKLKPNNSYGIRVGLDLHKIIKSATSNNYQGFELVGDYRLTKKHYLAAELGNEKRTLNEKNISTTASGSFIKVGIDYNAHKNLIGMRNLIYVGFRYGYANFSQDLNSFNIINPFNADDPNQNLVFDSEQLSGNLSTNGLSAHWAEFIAGMKAEVFNNIFLGFSLSIKRKFAEKKPDGFDNLYIPGFGLTNDFGEFGVGFTYFVSYYIPLYKITKKKKSKATKEDKEELPKK